MDNKQKYWTDYPFTDLGDVDGHEAPVRECEIISYDSDKYVTIRVYGSEDIYDIKSGYVYTEEGRFGDVPGITQSMLQHYV